MLAAFAVLSGCSTLAGRTVSAMMEPQPQEEQGEAALQVQGLTAPVRISLDRWGVPLIEAETEADLFYGLGWMHARDRRFQMELLRMDALGRLRELIGPTNNDTILRLEMFSRALGFREEAERNLAALPGRDRAVLEAYAAAANACTAMEMPPFEFRVLGYMPEPWTAVDVLAIMEMVSFGFCKNWEAELSRLEIMTYQLRTGTTAQRALSLWPARVDWPPHLIGEKPAVDPYAGIPEVAPELLSYLQEFARGAVKSVRAPETEARASSEAEAVASPDPAESIARALEGALDFSSFASNNWAVSGKWTGTGKAAFAMDPHMPHSLPPLTYLARLRLRGAEGGYDAAGASLAGLPAIPFGTNGSVAWGPTSNWADITDLYVEKPGDGPDSYLTPGGSEAFQVKDAEFLIRMDDGRFRRESRRIRATRHGVLVNDMVDRLPGDFPLVALKRPSTFGTSIASLSRLYRSTDVGQAREALSGFTAMVGHWALADAGGNIAYASAVPLPVRVGFLGTFPVPGWTGTYEWSGFVPVERLPWIENPPAGFLATANNQVVQPESTGYPINFEGEKPFRISRIVERLSEGSDGHGIGQQMRALQNDGKDMSFLRLQPFLREVLEPLETGSDATLARAALVLLDWNGVVRPQSAAPSLYSGWVSAAFSLAMRDEAPPGTLRYLQGHFNTDALIFPILENPDHPAWDDRGTKGTEDALSVAREAFREAVRALGRRHGGDVSGWTWQKVAPFYLRHAFGENRIMDRLNRGPLPTRGDTATVNMHRYSRVDPAFSPIQHGPALRLVVDFTDPASSRMSIPGGQSGRAGSPHYDDILPLYLKGDGIPVVVDPEELRKASCLRILLRPAPQEAGRAQP